MSVAIVTGGTRGIGHAISIALKNAGYKVAATYASNDAAAAKFKEETGIAVYKWDVANFEACAQGVTQVEKDFGENVSILINNAGITRDSFIHKMTFQQWQDVISTNLTSCFNMCHAVVPKMREKNFGRIVNLSSVNAQTGQLGQTNYCSSKAGMIGFAKALARENATKGITVNCLAPGYIDTEMVQAVDEKVLASIIAKIPLGRLGKAEELAKAVLFLVDKDSSYITGETLSINGGLEME